MSDTMKALDEIEAAMPYLQDVSRDERRSLEAAIDTLRAALTPPADDEIEAIRARHKTLEAANTPAPGDEKRWIGEVLHQALTDRATLLRALAAERARRVEVEGALKPFGKISAVITAQGDDECIVAAVNAVPELLALREEVGRLREQVRELSDCQRLPKVYRYTGTAEVDVENMFDVGHRHRSGRQPRDYLMSWLSMLRPFAYATKDDSWGELEKLISIVMNNYVQILVRAEKARAALNQEPGHE